VIGHYARNNCTDCGGIREKPNLLEFFYSISTLIKGTGPREANLLAALMQEATVFCERHSNSIPEFVKSFKNKDAVSIVGCSEGSGIRVSTIHGAKGLEARNVFLLDFDMEPDRAKTRLVFLDKSDIFQNATEPDSLVFFIKPRMSESFDEVENILAEEYNEEKKELMRLLYVAMTRARDSLCVFGNTAKNSAFALISKKIDCI
jgi:ATP-dependent exoDNAse (exonuclease V) beta subunit